MIKPKEEWPQAEVGELEDDSEDKKEKPKFTLSTSDKLHELLVRYSSWKSRQRRVAGLLKFKKFLMHHECCENRGKYLTRNDLEEATVAIVTLLQRETYSGEKKDLEKRGNVKVSRKIVRLRPLLIDGVIRVGRCISEAPIALRATFAMINLSKHHVSFHEIAHLTCHLI